MSTGSRLSSGGHSDFVPPPPGVLTGIGPGKGRRRPLQDLATPRYLGRAAQYVRTSTEHQRYSTENQADAIRQYAERRGLEVIRTYADEGKSGLSLDGRDALQRLIRDVENGAADFSTILVYDVSRYATTLEPGSASFKKARQPSVPPFAGRGRSEFPQSEDILLLLKGPFYLEIT
jgi:hypothetical protein